MAVPLLGYDPVRQSLRTSAGFTFVEIVVTLVMLATITAIAVPLVQDIGNGIALGNAQRLMMSELQQARMKSVTSNRVMRVRFNCPAAKQLRMVELVGTPTAPVGADIAANRCSETVYPFPAIVHNPITLPIEDGPIRRLDPRVSFGNVQTIEFRPTGIAYSVNGDGTSGPPLAGNGVALTVTKGNDIRTVTVNALGKISAQ